MAQACQEHSVAAATAKGEVLTEDEATVAASTCLQVIVTGGSKGIGRAIVERFVSEGHRVLFTYITGYNDAMQLQQSSTSLTTCHLDQGDFTSVQQFKEQVDRWREGRSVDVLVNNAGLGSTTVKKYKLQPHLSTEVDDDVSNNGNACDIDATEAATTAPGTGNRAGARRPDNDDSGDTNEAGASDQAVPLTATRAWEDEALMRVNALGPLWITEALLPYMRKDPKDVEARSTVLFIGSIGGGSQSVMPLPAFRLADVMSKAALAYAVKQLAALHARTEIDIMCVSPGATLTAMFQQSTLDRMADAPGFVDALPKRRLIQPAEVAESVVWLCTHACARIFHGAVLDASQGLAVRPGLLSEYRPGG